MEPPHGMPFRRVFHDPFASRGMLIVIMTMIITTTTTTMKIVIMTPLYHKGTWAGHASVQRGSQGSTGLATPTLTLTLTLALTVTLMLTLTLTLIILTLRWTHPYP